MFLVEKVNNYIAFFYLTEESLWEGICESFGLIGVLTSGYISYVYMLAFLNIELTFLLAFIPFLAIVLTMIVCGVVFIRGIRKQGGKEFELSTILVKLTD